MRILVPSIIDPTIFRGGAGTASRGLFELLVSAPVNAELKLLPSVSPSTPFHHHLRQLKSVLASFVSPLPCKALFQCAEGYQSLISQRLSQHDYDLVLINGCDLLWVQDYIPHNTPVVVWAHNIEHELWAQQLDMLPLSQLMRALFASDLEKLRRFEIEGLQRANGSLFLSSIEADHMRSYIKSHTPLVVPPLFCGELSRRQRSLPNRPINLGFLANFSWWPNLDGIRWFLAEVFPYCKGSIHLHLFGAGSEQFSGSAEGVFTHGHVPDISQIWNACDAMICPIRTGGGVNIKLAEAVFYGMPVLATPYALQGLPVAAGPALAVLENAQDWIDFICEQTLDALAAATVPQENRNAFHANNHRAAVNAYLSKLV